MIVPWVRIPIRRLAIDDSRGAVVIVPHFGSLGIDLVDRPDTWTDCVWSSMYHRNGVICNHEQFTGRIPLSPKLAFGYGSWGIG